MSETSENLIWSQTGNERIVLKALANMVLQLTTIKALDNKS